MAMAMAPVSAHSCVAASDCIGKASASRLALHKARPDSRECRAVRGRASAIFCSASSGDEEGSMQSNSAVVVPPPAPKKPSPLEKGGTLKGAAAEGKDPSPAALGKKKTALFSGKFEDPRWIRGNWDLTQFTKDGKVNWDSVIDAEVLRRKWLEENPEASSNDDPVLFESGTVPWWAWVKRFHLPEAELLNGRAAMVGFFAAYVVDSLTGIGLVDQTSSFIGKLLLFITVVGVLLVRKTEDIKTLKTLVKESTFYDKQWQATWKEGDEKK